MNYTDKTYFSIVVPTYNRASMITKTIMSLLNVDYENFEIIVIDDGSTDNTGDVIKPFIGSRLKYFKKVNGERGAARNYGSKMALGEYINYFDSDDLAYSNHLKEACEAVIRLNKPEVFHLGYDVKDDGNRLIREAGIWPLTINDKLIEGNYLSCNGVFLRKDTADNFQFSEDRVLSASEDYELWLRLASRYPIHCINVITSTVVNHDSRSVLQINLESFLSRIKRLKDSVNSDKAFLVRYGNRAHVFAGYLNIYIALHLGMAGYPRMLGINYLYKALILYPKVLFTRRFLAALKNIIL